MAAGDASGRQLVSLLVASLTVFVPMCALVWSAAVVSPPLSEPPARLVVIEPVMPVAATNRPDPTLTDDGTTPSAASNSPLASGDQTKLAPTAIPAVAAPPVVVPAATIVAAQPVPIVTASPTPRVEAWTREASFNFIALGVDQRSDGELTRTDTLMLGNIDTVRRRLAVVSIPRDLVVDIPEYGQDRINTVYVYGEQFKEPDGGIGLLKRTIERNFGIPVHHYGLIDFDCFRTAVDAVGGVTVDVPREIDDPYYPTEDFGYKQIHFDVGRQRMNGERALEYARTRYADNDFGRIRRQQLIAAALRNELLTLRTLPALPSLIGGCRNMRTDLGWRDYLALASVVQGLRDGDVTFRSIDEQMAVETVLSTGAWVLLPRWEPIRAMIRENFQGVRRPTTAGVPDGRPAGTTGPVGAVDGRDSVPISGVPDRRSGIVDVGAVDRPMSGDRDTRDNADASR